MSLKDALLKAGLNSTKTENMRNKVRVKDQKKSEKHQQERNFCEVCELIHPDVERFKHRNPTIDAEWICVACADKEQISDDFRVTNQSEFARQKRYRREFGATKDFSDEAGFSKDKRNNRNKRNDRKNFGGRSSNNRGPSRGKKPFNKNRRDGENKPKKNYTIDENGEKNFNC